LINKFGWVNQPEYIKNRKHNIRVRAKQKTDIKITYSYLWAQNISEQLGASRVDVKALAYGSVLDVPVVTDDSDMAELAKPFGIEIWGLLDLLKIMYQTKFIKDSDIKALVEYLAYIKDLPYPTFQNRIKKAFKIKL